MSLPHSPAFPSIEALRAHLISALNAALTDMYVAEGEDPCRLVLHRPGDGAANRELHLGNLAAELVGQAPSAQAHARLDAFVQMVRSLSGAMPGITLDRLYPALRHGDFPANSGTAPLTRSGLGDCVCVLMADQGEHTAMVTEPMLEAAGIALEEAWLAAEDNFAALVPGMALYGPQDGLHSLEIDGQDWLGSSLLLLPGMLRHLFDRMGMGAVYVMVPTRQSVDFIPCDAPDVRAVLSDWMEGGRRCPHPQSDMVFRLDQGSETPRAAFMFSDGQLQPFS
ncbi:MAG: hypothetical protein N4A53_12420 [Pelagimonas sp.]|jgi:hypothetical protein|nr:hypothetical protein [Pelagimonas sp.]